jgi:hypothetical protein
MIMTSSCVFVVCLWLALSRSRGEFDEDWREIKGRSINSLILIVSPRSYCTFGGVSSRSRDGAVALMMIDTSILAVQPM